MRYLGWTALVAAAIFGLAPSSALADQRPQAAPANLQATWTSIGPSPTVPPPTGGYREDASGRITGIAPHPTIPNIIYIASAGGGVWMTSNGGAGWTHLTDDQATLSMGAIAISKSKPQILYAGTGEANHGPSKEARNNIYYGRGVLKSVNGGASWTLLGAEHFDRRTISRIVIDPANPDIVYVAVGALAVNGLRGHTGIWKSADAGASWANTTEATISSTAAYSDLVMDPNDSRVLYAAVGQPDGPDEDGINRNGVYRTDDAGATWNPTSFPATALTGRVAIAVSRSSPGTLYAASARNTDRHLQFIRRSDDAGVTWTSVTNPLSICPSGSSFINVLGSAGDYHLTLAVDPASSETVYLGGICLIRSVDGGASWERPPLAPGDTAGPHRDHHSLEFDALGRLLNGNDGGIWRLDGSCPTGWCNLNGDLQTIQMIGFSFDPTDRSRAYGGTQDTGTVRYEGTLRWPRLLRGDGGANATARQPDGRTRVYQVTRLSSSGPVFRRSEDGGDTFQTAASGIDATYPPSNFYPPIALDPNDIDHVLLGTDQVYETVDAGWTWTALPSAGWTVFDAIDALALVPAAPATIYAAAGSHLLVSTDGGATWSQRDPPGVTGRLKALVVNGTDLFAVSDGFGGAHVLRSSDGGPWTDLSGNLRPDLPVQSMAVDPRTSPATLYVGTDAGVYASSNMGGSWLRFGDGLPNALVADLKLNISTGTLAAATHGRGVWLISV